MYAELVISMKVFDRHLVLVRRDDDLQFLHIAALLAHQLAQYRKLCGGLLRIQFEPEPSVAKPRDAPKRRHTLAAEDDGQLRALRGLGIAAHTVEAHELAGEAAFLFAPQLAHHLDIFAGPLRAPLEWNPERGKFFRRPTDADAERDAAGTQAVETRDHLRERERIMLGDEAYSGREANAAGARSRVCQADEWIEQVDVAARHEAAVVAIGILRIMAVEEDHVLGRIERRKAEPLSIFRHRTNGAGPRRFSDSDRRDSNLHDALR